MVRMLTCWNAHSCLSIQAGKTVAQLAQRNLALEQVHENTVTTIRK